MPLPVSIEVPSAALAIIRDKWMLAVDSARQNLVQDALLTIVEEVHNAVPVDTGETRNAWQLAQQQVAETLPASAGHTSQQSASVAIEQMRYIEYGTSRMRARAPVRTALARIVPRLLELFRLG